MKSNARNLFEQHRHKQGIIISSKQSRREYRANKNKWAKTEKQADMQIRLAKSKKPYLSPLKHPSAMDPSKKPLRITTKGRFSVANKESCLDHKLKIVNSFDEAIKIYSHGKKKK